MIADLSITDGPSFAAGVIVPAGNARITVDAAGLDVLPGLIDVHGDAFERALSPRPGVMIPLPMAFAELEAQLLAAGITTAFLAVTVSWEAGLRSNTTYAALRDALLARPKDAVPALKLHVRFEAHNLAALDMICTDIAAGHVQMVSFNNHTPSILRKLPDRTAVAKLMDRAGQDYSTFKADAERAGSIALSDVEAGRRSLGAAAVAAGIALASHDDATLHDRARFRALGATISEFPTTQEVAQNAIAAHEPTVMGAPNVVRGGSHIGWHGAEALVRENLCTVLCSDYHYPSLLQAVYKIARNGSANFDDAIALVTRNATALARLPDRGHLAVGQRGDAIVVDPGDTPRVIATICAGKLAYLAPDALSRVAHTYTNDSKE
jgi:alpha-D-ribose 1-methylphosphonate 5-triphosphate diphosphatase